MSLSISLAKKPKRPLLPQSFSLSAAAAAAPPLPSTEGASPAVTSSAALQQQQQQQPQQQPQQYSYDASGGEPSSSASATYDPEQYAAYWQQYYAAYYQAQAQAQGQEVAGSSSSSVAAGYDPAAVQAYYEHAAGEAGGKAPAARTQGQKHAKSNAKTLRTAGGEAWVDPTLDEWDPNDWRIFVGNLGSECDDGKLADAFRQYPSFQKARVVFDKRNKKSREYGFVSFRDPNDYVRALKEMNGKHIHNRPCKLSKSTWDKRSIDKKTFRKEVKAGHIILRKD